MIVFNIINILLMMAIVICALFIVTAKDKYKAITSVIIMNLFLILKFLLLDAPGAAFALVIGGGTYILLLFLNPLGLNRVKGGTNK